MEHKKEAERWIEVAGKLLEARDLLGCRRFAKRAQKTHPQVEGVDQMVAIVDVLLASEKRMNNRLDWYAILQVDRQCNDLELIRRQYRKLTLLLHPDKNKSPFCVNAFKLVCDAWGFLSDPTNKSLYDNEFNDLHMKFDPIVLNNQSGAADKWKGKDTPRRTSVREKRQMPAGDAVNCNAREAAGARLSTFWTVCPYCYHLYEYPRVYEDCCLRCQNCRRAFHGVEVASPPPSVGPGKDFYYCCWAFFPIALSVGNDLEKDSSWTPFNSMFSVPQATEMGTGRGMAASRSDLDEDEDDDLVDDRSGKKRKTDNLNKNVSTEKTKEGSGNGFDRNECNKDDQNRVRATVVEVPQKTVRIKTTARKSVKPKTNNNQTVAAPENMVNGGKSHQQRVPMDLNTEDQGDAEETTKKAGAVEGEEIEGIDKKATEGIGLSEGLDDMLENLPMLSVPGDQKAHDR